MGFELTVIVSSPLPADRRIALRGAALERWPFLRLPVDDRHPERMVLGSIERTSYMLSDHGSAARLDGLLETGLAELSASFPELGLARVYTDCFGGHCVGECEVWRAGERMLAGEDLVAALAEIGLESTGYFAPFERDHFGANFTPRPYAHLLGDEEDEESGEDDEDDEDEEEEDEPQLPEAGWLARTLAQIHEQTNLDDFERSMFDRLDQLDTADEAWRVLADWLAQRGHPAAEALQLDLLDHLGEPERDRARALREACWTEDDRRVAALAPERRQGPVTLTIGPWAPRIWLDWRGPFLARLVVEHAWAGQARPGYARWLHYQHRDLALVELRKLLELPCARYLSPRRVSLLACPFEPSLEGHDFRGLSLDASLLGHRPAGPDGDNCRDIVQLRGACFDGASLQRLSATRADLRAASLIDVDLRQADLRQADLRDADLRGARLAGADLRHADLRGANLDNASLEGANLEGAHS